mgnify:CR=1 FL=1
MQDAERENALAHVHGAIDATVRELLLKGCIKEDKIAFARTLLIAADTSCTIEELDETTDLDNTLAAADVSFTIVETNESLRLLKSELSQ